MCLNETYYTSLISKHLSDLILNGLRREGGLLPLLFNVALQGLKFIQTNQVLVHADDMNLLGDNMDATKKNTQTVIGGSNEG
jgi:hypothetical protein